MRQCILVLLLFISWALNAQQNPPSILKTGENTGRIRVAVSPQQVLTFDNIEATGIAIRYSGTLGGASISAKAGKFLLSPDEHYQGEGKATNLVVFDEALNEFELFTGEMNGEIAIIIIDAGQIKIPQSLYRQQQQAEECMEPALVDQSIWREGLPEPSYNRSFTETQHIIVHHSATSNELEDYTNVVRNIYLYHTQSNGWSDIGYNYLIAPDGTIFKGRDPASGEQDLVLGAHFCGSNGTTMGICLLGTYTHMPPSGQTLAALAQLQAWKVEKDELNPFGVSSHPLNSSLPVIAGHRDGCSTECPGQETYELLPQIRTMTAEAVDACGEDELLFAIYPNPAAYYFKVELLEGDSHRFELYDMRGLSFKIRPAAIKDKVATFSTGDLASGMYILHYQSQDQLVKRRLVIVN